MSAEGSHRWTHRILMAAAAVAIVLVPLLYPQPFVITSLVFIAINIIVCVGLSLIFGYAGQLSLTQAAFYGIGAYTSAIMTTRYGFSFWAGLLAASTLPGIAAFVIGSPILKLRHFYLAMATLAFSQIATVVFIEEADLTGGSAGIANVPPPNLFGFLLDRPERYYYLSWFFCGLVFWFSHNLINSKYGRALRAIGDNELAASAMGVNVPALKNLMFVLGAIYAGLAGGLYVHFISFISPDMFSVTLSIALVVMVAIGGLRSLWGAVLGAVFITILPSFLGGYRQYAMLIYGIVLVLALMFMPEGIAGAVTAVREYLRRLRLRKAAEDRQ